MDKFELQGELMDVKKKAIMYKVEFEVRDMEIGGKSFSATTINKIESEYRYNVGDVFNEKAYLDLDKEIEVKEVESGDVLKLDWYPVHGENQFSEIKDKFKDDGNWKVRDIRI
ncbi:MAG: hypothetical protein CME33_25680 [Gimesia sp.]|uniref:hypothetical protein n=1 Tax=Gimesia sp. TaxID=2024833 RepID=UPI000C5B4879|nr:hypothetical protein [Gimesia sp.]MAX39949.1 hypothetical protein [Gimesia sp.]